MVGIIYVSDLDWRLGSWLWWVVGDSDLSCGLVGFPLVGWVGVGVVWWCAFEVFRWVFWIDLSICAVPWLLLYLMILVVRLTGSFVRGWYNIRF